MAKKQSQKEHDWLDELKKSMESDDGLDTDDYYEDKTADESDEDFDAYLAELIGKQIAQLDGDVLSDDSADDPWSEDDKAPWDEDDVTEDIVEQIEIAEEIEQIGTDEEIEQIETDEEIGQIEETENISGENFEEQQQEPVAESLEFEEREFYEDTAETEEEIDEEAEEAAYLAYIASLTSGQSETSSIGFDSQKDSSDREALEQTSEDTFEAANEACVKTEEETAYDISEEAEEETAYDISEESDEEKIEMISEEISQETAEEADAEEIFAQIPDEEQLDTKMSEISEEITNEVIDESFEEKVRESFAEFGEKDEETNDGEPEKMIEETESAEETEESAEDTFERAEEDEVKTELPVYSAQRQRELRESRIVTDAAVELSDKDVERLMELGYERELVDQIGLERFEKIRRRAESRRSNKCDVRGAFVSRGEEFNAKAQIKSIVEKYRKERISLIIRLIATAFVALLILIFNEPALFGVKGFFGISYSSRPWLCSLIGLQLMLIAVAISYKFMYNGIMRLIKLEPDKYSPIVLSVAIICIYGVVISFSPSKTVVPQYNFVGAILLIYAIIGDFIRYRHEAMAFRVAASSKEKYSLSRAYSKKEKYKTNGKVQRIINDSKDERVYKVRKMILPAGFFKRVNSDSTNHTNMNLVLSATLVLSAAFFAVTVALGGGVQDGISAFMISTLICMPVSTLIYRLYPLFSVSEKIGKYGCTILGEGDIEEYSGKKTLLLDDNGLFFGRANTEILFKSSGDITKYIRYSKYVFDAIGGTLADIIESPSDSGEASPKIEFTEISETGVVAIMGDETSVVVGDTYYLKQHGIAIPRDCEERTISQKRESSIIYLAFDGKVKLGYEFEYKTTRPFETLLRRLEANNTSVAIYTKDPNINVPFLNRSRSEDSVQIGVVKENSPMSDSEPENIDCGLIAIGAESKITIPVIACEQLRKMSSLSLKIRAAIYVFSAVCLGLLCAFGVLNVVNSLLIIIYQALCTVPIFIATSKKIKYEEFINGTKAKRDTQVGK